MYENVRNRQETWWVESWNAGTLMAQHQLINLPPACLRCIFCRWPWQILAQHSVASPRFCQVPAWALAALCYLCSICSRNMVRPEGGKLTWLTVLQTGLGNALPLYCQYRQCFLMLSKKNLLASSSSVKPALGLTLPKDPVERVM